MPTDKGAGTSAPTVDIGRLSFEDKLANFILATAYSNEHVESWLENVGVEEPPNKKLSENKKRELLNIAKQKFTEKVAKYVEAWQPYLQDGQQLNVRAYVENTSFEAQFKAAVEGKLDINALSAQQLADYMSHPETIPGIDEASVEKIKKILPKEMKKGLAPGGASEIHYDTVAVTVIDRTLYIASNTKTRKGVTPGDTPTTVNGLGEQNTYLSYSLFNDGESPVAGNEGNQAANRIAVVEQLQQEFQGIADFDKVVFIGIGSTPQSAAEAAKPHAEMQLISFLQKQNKPLNGLSFGISKPACISCETKLTEYEIQYRNGSETGEGKNTNPKNWLAPESIQTESGEVKIIHEVEFGRGQLMNEYRSLAVNRWRRPSQENLARPAGSRVTENSYNKNIIVQVDGDPVSFQAALNLYRKYPTDKVQWLQWNPTKGAIIDAVSGQTAQLTAAQQDQLLLVGHSDASFSGAILNRGTTLAGMDANRLTTAIFEQGLKQGLPQKISLIACGLGATDSNNDARFVSEVANKIANLAPNAKVKISAQDTLVRINTAGQRETLRFLEDGRVTWKAGDHQHKVIINTNGEGGVDDHVVRGYGEGEISIDRVSQAQLADVKLEDALAKVKQSASDLAGVNSDAFFEPANELKAAKLFDLKLAKQFVESKLKAIGKQPNDFVDFADGTDFKSGRLVVQYQDGQQLSTQTIDVDANQFRTFKTISRFRQELARGTAHTSRALGIFMSLKGLESLSNALEKGDAAAIAANSALTLYGFGELANAPQKIVTGAGKLLAKATTYTASGLSDIAARKAAPELAKLFTSVSQSGAAGIRSFSKLLGRATPLVGIGLGVHGMIEDLKDPDKVRGVVNFALDFLATATGVLASIPSPLSPLFEAMSIGFTLVRIGFGTLYDSIKQKMSEVPDDASWQERAEAFFVGLGDGIEKLFYEFHPIGNILNAIQRSEALENQYREDTQLLSLLADYRNYYSIIEAEEGGAATIDFANAPASYYGGNLRFKLANAGADSSLTIGNMSDVTGQLQDRTFNIKAEGVQNIILGLGQSPKFEMETKTVKMLWTIPINSKNVIKRNEQGGIDTDSASRQGSYEGNDKNNVFQVIQRQPTNAEGEPIGAAISEYQYQIMGKGGDDLFVLGPQKITVSGGQGADTYIAGKNAANWLTINNKDETHAPEFDTLVLDAERDTIQAFRAGLATKQGSQWLGGRYTDDLIVIYKDSAGKERNVRVSDFFKGKAYQHLQIKTKDGHILNINTQTQSTSLSLADHDKKQLNPSALNGQKELVTTSGKVKLIPISFDLSSQPADTLTGANFNGQLLAFSQVQQVTGTRKVDQLVGNKLGNILNGYGTETGTDQLKGGNGSDFYMLQAYLDRRNNVEINNQASDKVTDFLVLGANYSQLSAITQNDNDLQFQAAADSQLKQQRINQLSTVFNEYNKVVGYLNNLLEDKPSLSKDEFVDQLNQKSLLINGEAVHVAESERGTAVERALGENMAGRLRRFALNLPPAQPFNNSLKQQKERYAKIAAEYQQQLTEAVNYKNNANLGSMSVTLKNWSKRSDYQHLNILTKDNLTLNVEKNGNNYQFTVTGFDASMSANNVVLDRNQLTQRHPLPELVKFTGSRFGDRLTGNDKNNVMQGGGNNGHVYSYDTLIGGKGHDVYIYTPNKDGLVVLDTNSTDTATDLALFNANFADIKVTTVNASRQESSIYLGESIGLYVEGQRGGLVIQHYQRDNAHRNLVFKSRDGKLFSVNPTSLEKQLVSAEDNNINQLIQSISGFNSETAMGGNTVTAIGSAHTSRSTELAVSH
ncbi:C80 family cysteine peptidase [Spartinivicinus ruber]|uniref:C80 family cysteine peptidase n=1 Tax=Spartinivicinus ruber TaxID=2683272 RepID=UPI0013D5CF89|nr:C80 family cysteine peptidase [Spartinivicinus ruber]